MLEEFLNYKLINPISYELFDNIESLFLEYEYDDYMDEIEDILNDKYEGDSIQSELLSIYDRHLDIILNSFGIHIDNQMRFKIDILEAMQVLCNLDKDLAMELLENSDNKQTVTEVFEYLVEDYLKTDFSIFDLNGVIVTNDTIEMLKTVLKNNDLDVDDLHRFSRYGVMKNKCLKYYKYDSIEILITNLMDLSLDNEDKLMFLKGLNYTIDEILANVVTIYLFMDNLPLDMYRVIIEEHLKYDVQEQVLNALSSEIERFK